MRKCSNCRQPGHTYGQCTETTLLPIMRKRLVDRDSVRTLYERRKAAGVCRRCCAKVTDGQVACPKCRRAKSQRHQEEMLSYVAHKVLVRALAAALAGRVA